MHIGPIIRATLRNKTGAILIALQIAFTMTVVVNSWFMISERLGLIDRPSGLVEADLFHIQSTGFAGDFNAQVTVDEDLAMLRDLPGIVDAVQMNSVPLSGGGWSSGLRVEPGEDTRSVGVAIYMVDDHAIDTFGSALVAGENFNEADIVWRLPNANEWPGTAVITEAAAREIFPDLTAQDVVGKTVYISNTQPVMIKGIIERLQAPWSGSSMIERTMLVPQKMAWSSTRYMIRTEPGERDRMMPIVEERLAASNPKRIVRNLESMDETRQQSYALDSGLSQILIFVMAVLVVITAVGVLGLASFSVKRRTKQIGTRRALGATRADILRYFLVENLFITGLGVLLGAAMTIGFNVLLVDAVNFPKIHWASIPAGMAALLLVGQAAVIGPARRACEVSPAVATRTV